MSEEFPDEKGAYEIAAPGKINLRLRILGRREDGYHEIDTRMVPITLADRLRLQWRSDDRVVLRCSDAALPTGEENLAVRAVRALERHTGKVFSVTIELTKRIPSGAGLGGGSSDAAAVLRAVNEMASLELPREELRELAAGIGSDVAFFLEGGACDCRGRGEIATPVPEPLPPTPVFLIKPAFAISAGWAYQRYAESSEYEGFRYGVQQGPLGEMVNDLERPVFEKFPLLGEMKSWLLAQPETAAALLSGSGSTMLALLHPSARKERLEENARERYGENCWTYLGETR